MTPVADLLTQSRAQHLAKKHYAGKVNKTGTITSPPNYPAAEAAITDALLLRRQAHALDPEMTDPAWAEDLRANNRVTSADLMTWFEGYLTNDPHGALAKEFAKTGQIMRDAHRGV